MRKLALITLAILAMTITVACAGCTYESPVYVYSSDVNRSKPVHFLDDAVSLMNNNTYYTPVENITVSSVVFNIGNYGHYEEQGPSSTLNFFQIDATFTARGEQHDVTVLQQYSEEGDRVYAFAIYDGDPDKTQEIGKIIG